MNKKLFENENKIEFLFFEVRKFFLFIIIFVVLISLFIMFIY